MQINGVTIADVEWKNGAAGTDIAQAIATAVNAKLGETGVAASVGTGADAGKVIMTSVKAGKDFDLLMIPNAAHGYGAASNYMMRRRWDYFVQHLLGQVPPAGYQLKTRGRYEFNSGSRP